MMKTQQALVVEDDDRIMDQIDDTLFCLGHSYQRAASQAEAQIKLEAERFDYVLLDLHIPARPGRGGASVDFGLHLLKTIRQRTSPVALPVIIMTGQSAACVDLVSELNRFSPSDYISKPWPENGRTLAAVIDGVLRRAGDGRRIPTPTAPSAPKVKFVGTTINYQSERIEVLGRVLAESSHRSNFWNLLQSLRKHTADGRFRAFSGRQLAASFKGPAATQNTVASCVSDLRKRFAQLLAEAGFEAGEEDVIQSGGPGYRFNEWMTIGDDSIGADSTLPVPQPAAAVAVAPMPAFAPENTPLSERQFWVLERLRSGAALQRADLEKHFNVTAKTAKRDLTDLLQRSLIIFVRTPRPGRYAVATR
jgi:DNA-binding response OmpR family regulator